MQNYCRVFCIVCLFVLKTELYPGLIFNDVLGIRGGRMLVLHIDDPGSETELRQEGVKFTCWASPLPFYSFIGENLALTVFNFSAHLDYFT